MIRTLSKIIGGGGGGGGDPAPPHTFILQNCVEKRIPDYTSVRVKLNLLGLGVSLSPLVALVSVELHS